MRPLMASSGGPNNVRRYHSCLVPVQHSWWHLCAPTFVIIFVIIAPTSQNQLKPPSDSAPENGICQSMDIRNSLDAFEMLRGCRVVEGFVQILLIDSVNETLLSMMSFPELTEITDFLLLYRVSGLRSIGQLFPNLTVIHGKNTHKYDGLSLMIFEMPSLQEIGLYSLTNITGHVRIDKNPSLCFVNTIDWKLISSDRWVQYIYTSKPDNECPLCPGDENPKAANAMPFSCPKAPGNSKHHLCWNRQHCQKVCRPNCTACNNKGECCSPDCLGGCADDDVNHCSACRHLELIDEGNQRRCVKNCPKDFYKFLDRRCIQKEECMKLNRPLVAPTKAARPAKPYLIFKDSCVLDCPVGYMSDFENRTCKLCEGGCKKDCPGLNVDSIESVKQLQGCTNITGSLEIQLRGGNKIVNELEESLGLIEEIQGHLKIVRSFSILSLSFLKSLKVIRGEQLDSGKYSFIVLDNQNLQELWNFTEHKIQILKGRLFFHFNPKLCLSKIEELAKVASLGNITDMEVAKASNGDKVACNVVNLEVSVTATFPTAVTLIWSHLEIQDQRSLLGYIVYIIEAPHKNITLYDGRDACGNDGWRVDDVQLPENQDENVTHLVSRLKPYTQYAFYVKTYTIATENRGAQSKINYFRTKPATPMVPDDLNIKRVGYDSLKITWRPPRVPNGKIVQYFVSGKKMNFSTAENDFCRYDLTTRPQSIMLTPKPEPPKVNNENTCVCQENTKSQFSSMEDEEAMRIGFEDELQNHVYVKKGEEVYRSKRDSNSESSTFPTLKYEKENEGKERKNLTHEGYFTQFFLEVNGSKTEVLINQLHHYTYYDIYVQACREGERDPQTPRCSNEVYKHERTSLKPGADNITNVRKLHSNLTSVTITWDEPKDPNGLVLSYNIEYRRSDIENAQPTPECITHKNFIKQGRKYTLKLNPGNYSLRVSAQTSNGMGEKSQPISFYVNESTSYLAIILGVLISFLIAGSIMFAYLWRRQKKQILVPYINPEYAPTVYIPDEWEMPRKNVELIKELGQGSFGMVWEGLLTEKGKPPIKCAVKTVNEHATKKERSEFLREASRMKAFDTAHVVHLLGVVSQGQPTLVIMELMAHGDLKLYLRSLRPDADTYDPTQKQPPSLNRILQMAIEIADGMAYLSAKKFIHNDLAARNCMVTENFTVKVGDFGMARDVYETDYYRKGSTGLLPVRWMAPESLKDGIFSSSSDVWSYGVVLWEMATLASQPYQGLSNDQVLRYVIGRGVMARPEHCPDQLYGLMRVCWKHQADERPSFIKIVSMLLDYARPDFCNISFYHSAAGIEARPAPSLSQDDASTPLRVAPDVNFSETYSDSNDEMGSADDHMEFPSITMGHPTTANGYISGRPTNGAATTQC